MFLALGHVFSPPHVSSRLHLTMQKLAFLLTMQKLAFLQTLC